MSTNRADILIEGQGFKLVPGEGAYEQGATRAMVDFQEIETSPGTDLSSRGDLRTVYQTSWAGGSRWEKPMIDSDSIDSYLISDGIDVLREPGSLYPRRNLSDGFNSSWEPYTKWVQSSWSDAYAVGHDGATYKIIAYFDNGSQGTLAQDSHVLNAEVPIDICYDSIGDDLFILSDTAVEYVDIGTGSGRVLPIPGRIGSTIFFHEGTLYVWDSDTLQSIADPLGTPVASEKFDDGAGIDWLTGIDDTTPTEFLLYDWSCRLAIPTTDGIFLAKNIVTGGTVVPWVYRIDRDALGNVIGTPIATLNPGSVILDLAWHQGNLVMASTSDLGVLGTNDATNDPKPRVVFHTWNGKSGIGVVGSARGNEPDEMVFKFLMADQEKLFIGGTTRVWAYDAVRGGVHPMFDSGFTHGHFNSGFTWWQGYAFEHGGITGQGNLWTWYTQQDVKVGTYDMESNYFNFSLPGETKTIVEVTLMTDGIQADETWNVYLSADDEAETLAASWTIADANTSTKALATPKVGVRFSYRIEYVTTENQNFPSKVKGVILRAISGRMVPYWKLLIDGSVINNFQNEMQRPQDVFDFFKVLRDNSSVVTFVDQYEGYDRAETTSYSVKVQGVSIKKAGPKDSQVEVVLVRTT